jgi:hypothetical protein
MPALNHYMNKPLAVLLICGAAIMAQGRLVSRLTYQQMFDRADLVAFAQPVSTNATSEQTVLPDIGPPIHVVGVETKFAVELVLKGHKATKEFVLHHYRDVKSAVYINGPYLVAFTPGVNESYLLFLKKEADGRYAPINGQTDPGACGILPSSLIDLVAIARPVSAKQQTEETTWNDLYRGRSSATPNEHLTGYQTEFAAQEVLKGEKTTQKFVLHHYERTGESIPSSIKTDFKPQRDQLYLLLLRMESEGRFGPITHAKTYGEELNPAGFSVIRLENAAQ